MIPHARPAYEERRERLRAAYAATPAGVPVRLAKRTSNLFRSRRRAGVRLDAGDAATPLRPEREASVVSSAA